MSGAATTGEGQQSGCRQSTGDTHPALNEKSTLASCRSTPAGGSVFAPPVISVNEYGEKSPVASSVTVSVSGSSATGPSTVNTCGVVSPVTTKFAVPNCSVRGSL